MINFTNQNFYKLATFASGDLTEDTNGFSFTLDLPGVIKEDIEMLQDGKTISIKASRKKDESMFKYTESFRLTREAESIEANLSDGVLTLKGLWKESSKPKSIGWV